MNVSVLKKASTCNEHQLQFLQSLLRIALLRTAFLLPGWPGLISNSEGSGREKNSTLSLNVLFRTKRLANAGHSRNAKVNTVEVTNDLALPYTVDLETCALEPIHHISSIQSIGFLIAVDNDWVISRLSANTADHLNLPIEALLGASLASAIEPEALHTLRNRIAVLIGEDAVERAFAVRLQPNGPSFDLAIHRTGDLIVIEAEPSIPPGGLNAGAMVRSMLGRMQGKANLVEEAARLMKSLTGFDRVMIYQFHPDGSGEVIAERVNAGLEPYLGLRYPASDIPQQARELLIRNPVRALVDIAAGTSPILPLPDRINAPLDLSLSTLRAHSLMHIEYLQNMGVAATMTVSLVRDGELWGLISCHHMTPRHVGFEQRTTAELFGQLLSFMIEKRERADIKAYEAHTRGLRERLIAEVIERGTTLKSIAELADGMKGLIPCDGIAVYINGAHALSGDTPTLEQCAALQEFLDRNAGGQIYATSELGKVYAPAQEFVDRAAGILVLAISRAPRDYLVFFRHEMAHAITWAGKPDKLVSQGPEGPRLTPRKSFEAWSETVRGQSAEWTPAELSAAEIMRTTLLEMVLHIADTTSAESRAATQKQELLIAELNHRVRNILSLIRGLVAQSRLSAEDVETFSTVLGNRVHALARAHDQITAKNWGPSSLRSLIAVEASAYLGSGAARVTFDGPAVKLQPQAFSTIALVVHELLTNAAKYGALSGAVGRVGIAWSFDAQDDLELVWHEADGPNVAAPVRRGFGSTIIDRSVPHELGGQARVQYEPSGLHARFVVPGRFVVQGEDPPLPLESSLQALPLIARVSGTILVVEDNMIIALETEDMLLVAGADRVLVVSNVIAAFALLATTTPDLALLDVNLGSETSWPIATRLRELGVRYVFCTGYGDGIEYPLEHRSAPTITKPYTIDAVVRAFAH
jgi:light-regulated signal transduction histidine kinase (bacteriophytochrome)/CheY-like chemotaxis protein